MSTSYACPPLNLEAPPLAIEAKTHSLRETRPAPDAAKDRAERSRLNGAKSHGPKTEEGKAKSSQNARKHGLTAKLLLVDPKDENAYLEFKNYVWASLKPHVGVEELLVENIVKLAWKLRQADNIETDFLRDNLDKGETLHDAFGFDAPKLMALSLYQTRLDRRLQKLFDQLRKLRPGNTLLMRDIGSLGTLGEAIRREKARRGLSTQNEQTNPDFEPEPPETNPEPEPVQHPDAARPPLFLENPLPDSARKSPTPGPNSRPGPLPAGGEGRVGWNSGLKPRRAATPS